MIFLSPLRATLHYLDVGSDGVIQSRALHEQISNAQSGVIDGSTNQTDRWRDYASAVLRRQMQSGTEYGAVSSVGFYGRGGAYPGAARADEQWRNEAAIWTFRCLS
jgi:hypothetical protein